MMTACFNLLGTQRIDIDENKSLITFLTQTISGHTYYFHLTRGQAFALDDALAMINDNHHITDFPLGQNIWFHHDYQKSVMYDTTQYRQSYFKFINFQLYRRRIHWRVMSFLRSRSKPKVTSQRGVKRARRTSTDDDDSYSEGSSANHQRPLSIAMRPASTASTTKESTSKRPTSHGATYNAVVSNGGKTGDVFPQRNDTSARRQHDSITFQPTAISDPPTPDNIHLSDTDSDSDCNSSLAMDCE